MSTVTAPIVNAAAAAAAPVKSVKPVNPVVTAYNTLRVAGLAKSSDGTRFKASSHVLIAATARKELGKSAELDLTGDALTVLGNIRIIEKNGADCLPVAIGGANPDKVTIAECFAQVLGFAADARKARTALVGSYIGRLK